MEQKANDLPPSAAEIGDRITEARNRRGWHQKTLASRTGINALQISRLERGQRSLRVEEACRLSQALGVTLEELVYGQRFPHSAMAIDLVRELESRTPRQVFAAFLRVLQLLLLGAQTSLKQQDALNKKGQG